MPKKTKNRLKTFRPISSKIPVSEAETEYWSQLKIGNVLKLHGPVKHISVSPVEPYMYAVPDSFEVILYRNKSDLPVRKFSNFKSQPLCTSFRSDGQLIAAGNEEGMIKIYPTSSRSELRSLRAHKGAIPALEFLSNNIHLCSVGKDSTMRVWDIANGSLVHKFIDPSKEQLRSLTVSKSSPNIVITGCFNGECKLYDLRMESVVRTFNHGFPVSCVSLATSDSVLASAGDSWIKLWSLAGDNVGSQLCAFNRHHKLVTAMSFACNGDRLISVGMDGLVKVSNTINYLEVAKFEYQSPLLSMAITPDNKSLIVGCEDGLLHTRRIRESVNAITSSGDDNQPLVMGKELIANPQSLHHAETKTKTLQINKNEKQLVRYQKKLTTYLRKFRHSDAFDIVFAPDILKNQPEFILTVIRELSHRRILATAVAGKSITELSIVMSFINRNLHKPLFTASLYHLATTILDVYSFEELQQVPNFKDLIAKAKKCVILRQKTVNLCSVIDFFANIS